MYRDPGALLMARLPVYLISGTRSRALSRSRTRRSRARSLPCLDEEFRNADRAISLFPFLFVAM